MTRIREEEDSTPVQSRDHESSPGVQWKCRWAVVTSLNPSHNPNAIFHLSPSLFITARTRPRGWDGGGKTPKFIDAIRRLKDRDTNNHIIFSYRYARMMRPDGPRDNFLLEPPPQDDEVERRHFQWPWTTATQFSRSRHSLTLNIWQTANDTAWLLQNANRKLYSTSFRLRRLVLCLMTLSDP